jgi:hypothetical protein
MQVTSLSSAPIQALREATTDSLLPAGHLETPGFLPLLELEFCPSWVILTKALNDNTNKGYSHLTSPNCPTRVTIYALSHWILTTL